MPGSSKLSWTGAFEKAIGDTLYLYWGEDPTQDEFIETFKNFYDEISAEFYIIDSPDDPRETAVSRANVVFVDDLR